MFLTKATVRWFCLCLNENYFFSSAVWLLFTITTRSENSLSLSDDTDFFIIP